MRKVLIVCLAMIALFSCRKGRLDDYYDDIKGKWKWVYSAGHGVAPFPYYIDIYSASSDKSIEFQKNARIVFYTDGQKDDSKIIKRMETADNILNGYIGYTFDLKGGEQLVANLTFLSNQVDQSDSLRILDFFPMDRKEQGHDTMYYYNVFVKE